MENTLSQYHAANIFEPTHRMSLYNGFILQVTYEISY